ncbi:MAG TPA: exodeoxyribonuclease VII large subunit [Chloroflexia bacterium]|nr:exodeoxyribonuclease VII large subunit [Chloroflexia bacterium]
MAMNPLNVLRVGQLANHIRELLDNTASLYDCWVSGEVSNVSQTGTGHYFFTLKDKDAQIKCVLFRQQAIWQSVLPTNGAAVIAHGRVSLYESTGNLQLYVDMLQEEGQGALYLAYEQLKAVLEAQGLFAQERKRSLPPLPRRIGIVTSPQAAALQDILTVLARRYPLAEVILAPSQVQGEGSARQVATAIAALNALPEHEAVDVIIVSRGGGSIEELWAFNEQIVAWAVFASRVPVVTGVGHETDFTIADYVADVRAPTPSAAAEVIAPDVADLRDAVDGYRRLLLADMRGRLAIAWDEIESERQQLVRLSPVWQVANDRQRVAAMADTMRRSIEHTIVLHRERVRGARDRLDALSPLQILKRGYAIVRDLDTGAVVASVADARAGHRLQIRVGDGAFGATVAAGRSPVTRNALESDDDDEAF